MTDFPSLPIPGDTLITITDAQAAGFCASGLRRWFRTQPQLDFADFLAHGLRADTLPLDDAGVQRLIAYKQRQAG